jgi:Protein of unknown function (DUF1566)
MKPGFFFSLALCGLPVLAQQICDIRVYPLSAPTSRFEDNGDGTVTDTQSHLMWMRCSAGQKWSGKKCTGEPANHSWQSAQEMAKAINERGEFFYNDWRMPQIRELATITERQCENPRTNLVVFPNTPSAFYWTTSSRPVKEAEESAFVLSFGIDGVKSVQKEETNHVRLVRTAQ